MEEIIRKEIERQLGTPENRIAIQASVAKAIKGFTINWDEDPYAEMLAEVMFEAVDKYLSSAEGKKYLAEIVAPKLNMYFAKAKLDPDSRIYFGE